MKKLRKNNKTSSKQSFPIETYPTTEELEYQERFVYKSYNDWYLEN